VKSSLLYYLALSGYLMLSSAQAATIQVLVDPQNPIEGETFTLKFVAEGNLSGQPDFQPLSNILTITGHKEGLRSYSNGLTSSARYIWALSVKAPKTGVITIPSIAFGQDQSPEFDLTVTAMPTQISTKVAFIQVKTDRTESYVQAQILITIDLYLDGKFDETFISPIRFSRTDVELTHLTEHFPYIGNIQKQGVTYHHYQSIFAAFPETSGPLTLEPILFRGGKIPGYKRRSFFSIRPKATITTLKSAPISLNILPIPDMAKGNAWIPAQQVQLLETWSQDPPEFTVGESITRTLSLMATGLTAAQLPDLHPASIPQMKQYPDQPSINTEVIQGKRIGIRQEKMAYVPTQPGPMLIPALSIPWWNTETKRQQVVTLPSRTITVLPAAESAQTSYNTQPNPVHPSVTPTPATSTPPPQTTSVVLLLVWVMTLIAWGLHWRTWHRPHKQTPNTAPSSASLKALKASCNAQDAALTYQHLLAWGRAQMTPFHLATFAHQLDEPGKQSIENLQTALYHPEHPSWNQGQQLYHSLQQWQQHAPKATPASSLTPLYPRTI